MTNKRFNNVTDFLNYVGQLNFVRVDGDKFIADNGARLSLFYKLISHSKGLSGVQLVVSLFATAEGGLVSSWGSDSDASNETISLWWQTRENKINEAEYEARDKAVETLRSQLV